MVSRFQHVTIIEYGGAADGNAESQSLGEGEGERELDLVSTNGKGGLRQGDKESVVGVRGGEVTN